MRKENFFEKFSSKSLKFSYFRGLTMRTLLAEKEKIKKNFSKGVKYYIFRGYIVRTKKSNERG